jgi:hypothetical protein
MHMGMTWDEFWHGEPAIAAAVREKYKRDREARSQEMWLQGLYIYDAMRTAIGNALQKKGARPKEYMKKPIRLTPLTDKERAAEQRRKNAEIMAYFERMQKAFEQKAAKNGH